MRLYTLTLTADVEVDPETGEPVSDVTLDGKLNTPFEPLAIALLPAHLRQFADDTESGSNR